MSYLFKQSLVKLEGWENVVTIVSCDMRLWNAPEKADILVCEYLLIVFHFLFFFISYSFLLHVHIL